MEENSLETDTPLCSKMWTNLIPALKYRDITNEENFHSFIANNLDKDWVCTYRCYGNSEAHVMETMETVAVNIFLILALKSTKFNVF